MIKTEEQLRVAADRLGVSFEDMRVLFQNRIPPQASETTNDSGFAFVNDRLSFHSHAINKAIDNSLLPICERAFGNPRTRERSISPDNLSPFSSGTHHSRQQAENSSAASVSSPAAAMHQIISGKAVDDPSISCEVERPENDSKPIVRRFKRVTGHLDATNTNSGGSGTTSRSLPSGKGKVSTQEDKDSVPLLSSTPARSPRLVPLDNILAFARGEQSFLTDVTHLSAEDATGLVRSLSIIPGCDMYRDCCVFRYVGALITAHLDLQKALVEDRSNEVQTQGCDQKYEITDDSWKKHFLTRNSSTKQDFRMNHPPKISKTIDLLQFIYRMIDKVSSYQESLTREFLEGLYASDVPKLVASLTTELLQSQKTMSLNESRAEEKGVLFDWCIRLLKDFIVFEVSPVSQARPMKNLSPDMFAVCKFGGKELPPLSTVIDQCFEIVSSHQTSKECRNALSELVQAFLIWSNARFTKGNPDMIPGATCGTGGQDCLDLLVCKEAFWSFVVHPVLQKVKKEPQLSDSIFEYTFLSSFLSISAARRALFEGRHGKCKQMLLDLMIQILRTLSRDLLPSFRGAEETRTLFPGIYTSIDFVCCLISSAVIQREILGAETSTRDLFLSSLETLITNAVKLVRYPVDADESWTYSQKGPFAKVALREIGGSKEAEGVHESSGSSGKNRIRGASVDDNVIAREKAVAFAARVIGFAGKSVEDGSWDMSQMSSMKALFQTRINSSRSRHRLWSEVYKIWRGVEKKIGPHALLSTSERNSFAMVVEVVRKHGKSDSMVRTEGTASREAVTESKTYGSTSGEIHANFPPVWKVVDIQRSVCSAEGFASFDDDRDILTLLKDTLINKGQQMLARYDPESEFAMKWVRLQRKNVYVGRARDLLDKADRTVGSRCSCVPGNVKKDGNETETRIACSSDLCENRHMKIECVPGSCGAQSYCMNQRMQRMDYAKVKMVPFPGKGIGIVADEVVSEGTLIGEYQGEVVTMEEYERRVCEYEGEKHFYFMTLTSKLVIDASRKSQSTRFLNHSCDPNAETQKWNADGEPRVGIFAKREIRKGEEITFDYGARSLARYSARCLCGAHNCRGLLAVRQENDDTAKQETNEYLTRNGDITKRVARIPSAGAEEEGTKFLEEDRRRSIINEKIETAKKILRDAKELAKKAEKNHARSRECDLDLDQQEKFKVWKLSLSEFAVPSFPAKPPNDIHGTVRFPRIPRRAIVSVPLDKQATAKGRVDPLGRTDSSGQFSPSRDIDPKPSGQRERSTTPRRRVPSASRWALFEETFSSKTGQTQLPMKRHTDGDSAKRFSKIPRADFLPTTSKLKKERPLRPVVAKRRRTRKHDDSDSMDEYSTASEAEPILEEPMVSPMKLPDGNGACSDDEFTAAPPLESIQYSLYGRRWNHSDYGHRTFGERQLDRNDYGRVVDHAGDRRRTRMGSGNRAEWNVGEVGQQLDPRSGFVGYRTPEAHARSDGGRTDCEDSTAHHPHPSGMSHPNRYREYRHEWSPSTEWNMQSQHRKSGKRRDEREIDGVNDGIQPPWQRRSRVLPAFSPDLHDSLHTRSCQDYPNAHGETNMQDGNAPRFHRTKDHGRPRTGAKDKNRQILVDSRQPRLESLSHPPLDAPPIRSDEFDCFRRDEQEGSHPSRFSRIITPQNFETLRRRPIGDGARQHSTRTEIRDMHSRNTMGHGPGDLRNMIGHRVRGNYR